MMQEYTQEMKNLMQDMIRGLHTVLPGRITSFNPEACEASVLPCGKWKKPNGEMMDFPKISGVPVYFPQGAGQTATVVYPVKDGDECILLFAEQTLDTWKTGAESDTDLRFDLTNAIAIVGFFAKANSLVREACNDNAMIIEKDGERVFLKKGETYIRDAAGQSVTLTPLAVTVKANNAVVNASANVTLTALGSVAIKGSVIELN